jgi:hypothetical protein
MINVNKTFAKILLQKMLFVLQNKIILLKYLSECNNNQGSWIDQEIFRLEDILDKTEFHLERSTLSAIQRKRYTKRRDRTRKFLAKAEVFLSLNSF